MKYLLVIALLMASVGAGCGKRQAPREKVFAVSGKVLVDGKPPEQAIVYFHPRNPREGQGRPFATVKADGSFQPGTYLATDGVPAGEYALTVVWPKVTIVGGEEQSGPDQLGGRYGDPSKPVATVTVTEGENVVPLIELKKR